MKHRRESPSTSPSGHALVALPARDLSNLDEERLLGFYDRLRQRTLAAAERRGGRKGGKAAELLMVVPDIFLLLVRLALDREVPAQTRAVFAGTLVYFLVPVDLLPEAFVGPLGFLDDLVLAVGVLQSAFSGQLEPWARRHWSGRDDLRQVLADIAEAAHGLLGAGIDGRLRRFLARRGVRLDPGTENVS